MTYIDFSSSNIGIKGKHIFINKLDSHGDLGLIVGYLNRYFNNQETKYLSVNFSKDTAMYGNLVTPLSIILTSLSEVGKKIRIHTNSEFVDQFCLLDPPVASTQNFDASPRILDKIWKIENEFHLNNTVKFLRRFFSGRLGFNEHLLNVLELAIIENIKNALIHSGTGSCCFMGQIHRRKNYFTLCVSDSGMGIQQSLSNGGFDFSSEAEALASAIKKGVTSRHFENLGGNGLYCLSRLAKINKGHFCLWSGKSSIVVDGKTDYDRILEKLPNIAFLRKCTHLDFQIPLSGDISSDYDETPANDLEYIETDGGFEGFKTLAVSELESGYCTRHAGDKAREIVKRFLEFPTVVGVVVDFDGIPISSMSFLDSFLGLLHLQIGQQEFNERIRVSRASSEIRKAIFRVTRQDKTSVA